MLRRGSLALLERQSALIVFGDNFRQRWPTLRIRRCRRRALLRNSHRSDYSRRRESCRGHRRRLLLLRNSGKSGGDRLRHDGGRVARIARRWRDDCLLRCGDWRSLGLVGEGDGRRVLAGFGFDRSVSASFPLLLLLLLRLLRWRSGRLRRGLARFGRRGRWRWRRCGRRRVRCLVANSTTRSALWRRGRRRRRFGLLLLALSSRHVGLDIASS